MNIQQQMERAAFICSRLNGEDRVWWAAYSACCSSMLSVPALAEKGPQCMLWEATLMGSDQDTIIKLPEDFKTFIRFMVTATQDKFIVDTLGKSSK